MIMSMQHRSGSNKMPEINTYAVMQFVNENEFKIKFRDDSNLAIILGDSNVPLPSNQKCSMA